ncbi:hypothetical protein FACS189413_08760 [Bacteroidia bacterium]|nr:hypothetical protein FACS189413_08760 [Bacteroidia bacterium]
MELFCYFVFALLTVFGLYFQFRNDYYKLRHPVQPKQWLIVDNYQFLFLFFLATSIISCGGELMANRMLTTILFLVIGLIIYRKPAIWTVTTILYTGYLLWLVVAWIYSPVKDYGFRVFLKYLYPFLIMLCVSKINTSIAFYQKAIRIILWVSIYALCNFLIFIHIPVLSSITNSVTFWGPAILDFFPIPITICLIYYSYSKQVKYLILAALLVLPSILFINRTGLLAASVTIVIFAVIRYRLKSLPYVALGVAILVGTTLYNKNFRDKMFVKQMSTEEVIERGEELTTDDINSNGRYAMWEWSLAHFFLDKEATGSGLGVLQHAFYTVQHPFGRLRVVHNDYIQILCDTGLVGLILYAAMLLSLIIHSLILYFRTEIPIVRLAASIAGIGLAGMLSTLYTDNVVNYSMMTLGYPFILYGMMLGLKKQYE